MIDMTVSADSRCNCLFCGFQMRSVGGQLDSGGDTTNLVSWTDAYDITSIPWGTCLSGYFSDPSHTSPDTTSTLPCGGGVGFPVNLTQCVGWKEAHTSCIGAQPCDSPVVYRSQFYLPLPAAYYVVAFGTSISVIPADETDCGSGGYWFAQGCIYPQQADSEYPMIVDLPIPDPSIDATIQVQYYRLGVIQPGVSVPAGGIFAGATLAILPDLSSLTSTNSGCAGFGANWNPNQSCDAPPDDPFTGASEWP